MLDTLLEGEMEDPDLVECCFLEALYCSLGASLLDDGRERFDESIKRLASLPTADTEGVWASPGQLPGGNRAPPVSLLGILGARFSEESDLCSPVRVAVWVFQPVRFSRETCSGQSTWRYPREKFECVDCSGRRPAPWGGLSRSVQTLPPARAPAGWHSIWGRVNLP